MGTMLTITAWGTDSAAALGAIRAGRVAVETVDALMSSYRPESDVARMANNAGTSVRVSPQTIHVLLKAREYWRITGGKFDPTVGPLVDIWMLSRKTGRIPSRQNIDSARALTGFGLVEIDNIRGTVRLPRSGMRIDLGGIAKGFALDMAREAMKGGASAGMIDLGGNVLVFGTSPSGDGRWRIGVVHPRQDRSLVGSVTIDSGAIATSGDYENFFVVQGVRYSHIIDPLTGEPAHGVVSATAVAPYGEWSDGMSASLLLLGVTRGIAAADSVAGLAAIIIVDPGSRSLRRSDIHLSTRAKMSFRFDQAFN